MMNRPITTMLYRIVTNQNLVQTIQYIIYLAVFLLLLYIVTYIYVEFEGETSFTESLLFVLRILLLAASVLSRLIANVSIIIFCMVAVELSMT